MSGTVPGAPWGNTLNQLKFGSSHILKKRTREQWVTQTIRGPRRVWRMSKWSTVSLHRSLEEANEAFGKRKRAIGLEELGIFFKSKRVK